VCTRLCPCLQATGSLPQDQGWHPRTNPVAAEYKLRYVKTLAGPTIATQLKQKPVSEEKTEVEPPSGQSCNLHVTTRCRLKQSQWCSTALNNLGFSVGVFFLIELGELIPKGILLSVDVLTESAVDLFAR
jgi:hypothetical protein